MTSSLELSDILEKVKSTSFKDDESIMSERETLHAPWNRGVLMSTQSSSRPSSNNSQVTLSSSKRSSRNGASDKQSSVSTRSRSTVHTSSVSHNIGPDSDIGSDSARGAAAITLHSAPKTRGHVTSYESSMSSSSSRHSSAQWSSSRDEVQSLDSLFDRLIDMAAVPQNALRIINSDGLDTLVAIMYPESCRGCGAMPLKQIFHPSKRTRRSQSIKAISDIYRNLGDTGRKHYKVQKHAGFLTKSMECLMDVYLKIRANPEEDISLPNIKPMNTLIALTRMSFDDQYRTIMNDLGVIFAATEFISLCSLLKPVACSFEENSQILLSDSVKYGCTLLTNLTCGDHHVKSALSQLTPFLQVIISLLYANQQSDVQRAIISLFRNMSWRASSQTKHNLTQIQTCSALITLGMKITEESTLKVLTSSLWNISAHNTTNKEVLCNEGLELLADLINQPVQRNTSVLENTLGILRNISSHIAQESSHRNILRELGILPRLVELLRSSNDTIVTTSAGALWNLSARSHSDQLYLRECGAVPILRSLSLHSDRSISKSATGALRNIMNSSHSRSVSPVSNTNVMTIPAETGPAQFWLDDYSLISSNDSRSRKSGSPPQVQRSPRKIEGRQNSKQKLRFSSTIDKFNC